MRQGSRATRSLRAPGAALAVLLGAAALQQAPRALRAAQQEKPLASPPAGSIDRPLSPRNASYTIHARLDVDTKAIDGSETIVWRNITTKPASDLQFHLYWNAWRDEKSTFMREAALAGSGGLTPEGRASIDITSITLVSAAPIDLTSAARFLAPDDGNADDRTVMQVPLPVDVAPGDSVTVELTWRATIPRAGPRTGYVGDSYFIAQWFPKLGVLEESGWNCHQFHFSTEFFSDFGVYDVSMTVPRTWLLGATGVERSRRDNSDGTTTHRYYQEDVHDFAWTTSPDFIERVDTFQHPALRPTTMRLLLRREHEAQAARHFRAARAALQYFGEWFGTYPYGHITIVDPAYRSDADGMEYPTLVTAGTRWIIPNAVTINTPEEVTIHEIGHQWWHGMVATNEFEDAWMDEGLTTFAAARVLEAAYPDTRLERRYFGGFVPIAFRDVALSRETYWNRLPGYRPAAESDDPSGPSFRFSPMTGRSITYNKTALWLNTLERLLGWPTLQRALATFHTREQFKHPKPDDFFRVLQEAAGQDLTWFFDQVHRSSNAFDYGIQSFQSEAVDGKFRTTTIVRRYGEAVYPVEVEITFENGQTILERWSGRDRWTLLTHVSDQRGVSAHVDPKRILLLDVNYTNNSRTLTPKGPAVATKWSLKWLIWLQDALLTWAFFVLLEDGGGGGGFR
jgi:hypothetical protein